MKLLFYTGTAIVLVLSILNAKLAWESTPKLHYSLWKDYKIVVKDNCISLPDYPECQDIGFVDKKTGIRIVVKYEDGYYNVFINMSSSGLRSSFFKKVNTSTTPPNRIFV